MKTPPRHVYELFFEPGEVVEIRCLGLAGKNRAWDGYARGDSGVFGYFDNADDFVKAAASLDAAKPGAVYFTPNPPLPSLISRVNNRVVAATKKRPATSNHEIRCIRWLLIDLDPQRPKEVSSTQEELDAAAKLGADIKQWLENDMGFPSPVCGMSGNGYHIMFRLPDLPNEPEISGRDGLIHRALQTIQGKFETPEVAVDQVVYNAARLWKLYGTWARKGDSTPDRPHRESFLFSNSPKKLADVPILPREKLEELAALAPPMPEPTRAGLPAKTSGSTERMKDFPGPLDVRAYLDHYGIAVQKTEKKGGSIWYILEHCLFDESHRAPDAAIVEQPDGPLLYQCFHNSCAGYKWADARMAISGTDIIAQFCANYDPDWKPKRRRTEDRNDDGEESEDDDDGYESTGILRKIEINPLTRIEGAPGVPSPKAINPMEFFEKRGKRPVFVVEFLAKYLAAYLSPIVYTSNEFWRYKNGYWRRFPVSVMNSIITTAMKDRVQSGWLDQGIRILAGKVNREEEDWMEYPQLINVKNGMVNLENGELIPHDPKYCSRTQLPVRFDLDAEATRWYQFLKEIFPEPDGAGEAKARLVQQFAGYCLLPTCKYERALFMFGTGANGKSRFLNAIESVLGRDNVTSLSIEDLAQKFAIPNLLNKMINISTEVETRDPVSTDNLKKCISGDLIYGERKFGGAVEFRNRAKFIFALNNTPKINDRSYGLIRKMLVINCNRRFDETEMDRELDAKLRAEADGIFLWMLMGAQDLIENDGFVIPDSESVNDPESFHKRLNPILEYIDERCVMGPDFKVLPLHLYEDYRKWTKDGEGRPFGRTKFYQFILDNFRDIRKGRNTKAADSREYFLGIGLMDNREGS